VVASFNFPENELIAEIYAQALEHAGVTVRRELDLGTREMVMPALHEGLVDVVPEYVGSAVAYLTPSASLRDETAPDERAMLVRALAPWHVEARPVSPAQDQNGLVVTQTLATSDHLSTVSDLAPLAPSLTLGAPTECPTRLYCEIGFRDVYGLRFARLTPFDSETQRVAALEQRVVDVALMFTTDGVLATGRFALLTDDRHLQPPDNVVALVSDRSVAAFGDRVTTALDAVSGALTSKSLLVLNWRISVAGKDIRSEATGWLRLHGLIPTG
jgi:osmoprotectant transport system substrate-binding protein